MSVKLDKFFLPRMLLFIGVTACNQDVPTNKTSSSAPGCNEQVIIDMDAVKDVYFTLINQEVAESITSRSSASLQSLRPAMSEEGLSSTLRELEEISINPSETERLLDDIQTHLHGLSDSDGTAIDKFERTRAVWKIESLKEEKILAATEKLAFWKSEGLAFQDVYQILDEKLSDIDLARAFKTYFLNDFQFSDFFLNNNSMVLFRSWIEEGATSDANSEFTGILRTLLNRDEVPVSAGRLSAVKQDIRIFFQGKNLETVNHDTKEIILALFDSYAKSKQVTSSTSEVASYLYDFLSAIRKQWHDSGYVVDEDVVSELKPLIPFVYALRRNIYEPKIYMSSRLVANQLDALSEQRVIWSLIILDTINSPTKSLKDLLSPQKIDQFKEIIRLLKRYNVAPLMKERETIEQINKRINDIPDEQVRNSLQKFIRIAKLAGSAGLISAPVWIPLAILFTLVPEKY